MMNRTLVLLLTVFLGVSLCWAQNDEQKTVSGIVVDLDWVSSTITVHYAPEFSNNADEINIKVSSDTAIHRGTNSISLSDILQSDPVTVTYYDDGASGLKAIRISDLNLAAVED